MMDDGDDGDDIMKYCPRKKRRKTINELLPNYTHLSQRQSQTYLFH